MCVIILHVDACFVCRNSCCAMLNTTRVMLDLCLHSTYTAIAPYVYLHLIVKVMTPFLSCLKCTCQDKRWSFKNYNFLSLM